MNESNRILQMMLGLILLIGTLSVIGCSSRSVPEQTESAPASSQTPTSNELAGTAWEMLEIQSMDDNAWAPGDPSRYTLVLEADGNAYMQLDCNRGRSTWTSEGPNQLRFGPVASTNALCQDDGLSERYAQQFEYVRSYVMRDGHLFLATLADGAIIEFRPGDPAADD